MIPEPLKSVSSSESTVSADASRNEERLISKKRGDTGHKILLQVDLSESSIVDKSD